MGFIKNKKSFLLYLLIAVSGLISAFLIFYTVRLFYITQGLSKISAGGSGTYIGAIVFPIIALAFMFISWRLYKTINKNKYNKDL